MKILIDIGHAGHVHYFKNLIQNSGCPEFKFKVIARDKGPILELLDFYNISYINRGKGSTTKVGKLLYLIYGNIFFLIYALKFKPVILLSHGGTYTALSSLLLKVCSITTEDTEGAKWSHFISRRTSNFILTPNVLNVDLGRNQVSFKSYMEYAYLHSSRFKKDVGVLKKYDLREDEKFIVVRLVEWSAHHDFGVKRLSQEDKIEIIKRLSTDHKIILSHESSTPDEIKEFAINIDPADLHHLLAFASLYIGEGATTSSEASILGTPAIYINPMQVCYCKEQEEVYGLSNNLIEKSQILFKAKELLKVGKDEFLQRAVKMESEKMDTTKFLVDLIKKRQQ